MLKIILTILQPYIVTIGSFAIAFLLNLLVQPFLVPNLFSLFYLAVIVSAIYGSARTTLLANILAAIGYSHFLLSSPDKENFPSLVIQLLLFISVNLLLGGVIGILINTKTGYKFTNILTDIIAFYLKAFALQNESLELSKKDINENKPIKIKLIKSEESLRQLSENIQNNVFWIRDLNSHLIYVSSAYQQIWGRSCESLYDNSLEWLEAIHPLDKERVTKAFSEQVFEEGFEEEYRILHQDGSVRWIRDRGFPLRDNAGKIYRIAGLAEDITERKFAREALESALQRLTFHVENTPLAVIEWDRDLRVTWWSKKAQKIFGWSAEEVVGKHIYDWQFVFKEDQAAIEDVVNQILSGTEKQIIHRNRNYTKHGSVIYCDWYNSALFDEFGNLVSVLSLVEDVTERQQAIEALKQSEERFRIVQELSLDAFTILRSVRNAEGKIIDFEWEYVNPKAAEILGKSIEELVGHYLLQVLPGNKTNSELFDRYVQVVETGIPHDIEIPYNSEGINGWFRNMTVKLNDGVAISFGDITKRKQEEEERINLLERERTAREEAEAANRIKDEFLAVLSHELRSPLNPIVGWSELLLTNEFDRATTQRALETIERNARLQTQLIEDLLDVSRILQGKLSLNICPVDLKFIIEAAIDTVYLASEAKLIDLQFFMENEKIEIGNLELMLGNELERLSIKNEKFWVLGDPNRLQQIIWNLLSNAIKFTSPGGKVEIQLSLLSESEQSSEENEVKASTDRQLLILQYAKIQVKDTGKGICPDFLPYVFDYFRQENSTTTRKFGGLGLGLAIVRHLAELHGGKILADSAGEGKGATFTLLLPLMPVRSQVRENLTKWDRTVDLNGISILVVDDDIDTLDFLTFMLERYGARVTAVDSALEALKLLPQLNPDLLLSDIGMPNMNGYTLMRQVRNLSPERGGKIPAIALTAYAGEADYKQAVSVGFQLHLSKPVEPAELAKAVASLLGICQ
ncbi:MAG TPA: PAS domain S-box protein [Leptolyngbyaceae cyanobacterium]